MPVFYVDYSLTYGEYVDSQDELHRIGEKEKFTCRDRNEKLISPQTIRNAISANGGVFNLTVLNPSEECYLMNGGNPDMLNHCYTVIFQRTVITIPRSGQATLKSHEI